MNNFNRHRFIQKIKKLEEFDADTANTDLAIRMGDNYLYYGNFKFEQQNGIIVLTRYVDKQRYSIYDESDKFLLNIAFSHNADWKFARYDDNGKAIGLYFVECDAQLYFTSSRAKFLVTFGAKFDSIAECIYRNHYGNGIVQQSKFIHIRTTQLLNQYNAKSSDIYGVKY